MPPLSVCMPGTGHNAAQPDESEDRRADGSVQGAHQGAGAAGASCACSLRVLVLCTCHRLRTRNRAPTLRLNVAWLCCWRAIAAAQVQQLKDQIKTMRHEKERAEKGGAGAGAGAGGATDPLDTLEQALLDGGL